jgi:hypothetical protein
MEDGTCLSTFTTCGGEGPRRLIMLGAKPAPELLTIHKVARGFRRIYLLQGLVNKGERKGRGALRPGPCRASAERQTLELLKTSYRSFGFLLASSPLHLTALHPVL